MTYGEYYYLVKYDMKLVNGNWVSKPPYIKIPSRMSKEEATVYYTRKFMGYYIVISIKMLEHHINVNLTNRLK